MGLAAMFTDFTRAITPGSMSVHPQGASKRGEGVPMIGNRGASLLKKYRLSKTSLNAMKGREGWWGKVTESLQTPHMSCMFQECG